MSCLLYLDLRSEMTNQNSEGVTLTTGLSLLVSSGLTWLQVFFKPLSSSGGSPGAEKLSEKKHVHQLKTFLERNVTNIKICLTGMRQKPS